MRRPEPLIPSARRHALEQRSALQDFDLVADSDLAGLENRPVDAAKMLAAKLRVGGQLEGVVAKAIAELAAAIVRLGRDLDDGFADSQPGSGGQVGRGQVEVDEEVVAGQLDGLPAGDELGDVATHDR